MFLASGDCKAIEVGALSYASTFWYELLGGEERSCRPVGTACLLQGQLKGSFNVFGKVDA